MLLGVFVGINYQGREGLHCDWCSNHTGVTGYNHFLPVLAFLGHHCFSTSFSFMNLRVLKGAGQDCILSYYQKTLCMAAKLFLQMVES